MNHYNEKFAAIYITYIYIFYKDRMPHFCLDSDIILTFDAATSKGVLPHLSFIFSPSFQVDKAARILSDFKHPLQAA